MEKLTYKKAVRVAKKYHCYGGLIFINAEQMGYTMIKSFENMYTKTRTLKKKFKEIILSIQNEAIIEGKYKEYTPDDSYFRETIFSNNLYLLSRVLLEIKAFGEIKRDNSMKNKCHVIIELSEEQQKELQKLKEKCK